MGRNAAGESFLRGYLKNTQADTLWAQVVQRDHASDFARVASLQGIDKPVKMFTSEQLASSAEAGTVYYPGPDISSLAFQRSQFGDSSWSLCGVTHTTSSMNAMDAITSWLTAPIQPWDAIICTSTAVKRHVEKVLQAEVNRLKERLGISQIRLPQLPVIPLGIHTDDFVVTDEQRVKARHIINADDETLVVLYMGRLSFHAKAHPLAMYQALEKAANATAKKIKLVECGWFANQYTEEAFKAAQTSACPSIEVIHLDGRNPKDRDIAWGCADVFCSLPDNIQETFGITPIEAMAAGLPVVVSDWDGYKDTVSPDVGIRVTTTIPQSGLGRDLAFRHASGTDSYDFHCGHTCSFIGVDIDGCADAFMALFNNVDLRETMGLAGRKRAVELYDWSKIIPRYEALWAQLKTIREKAGSFQPELWPARLDPFTGFAHYATIALSTDTQIKRIDPDLNLVEQRLSALMSLEMVKFAHRVLPTEDRLKALLKLTPTEFQPMAVVLKRMSEQEKARSIRSYGLLHKLGLIAVSAIEESATK